MWRYSYNLRGLYETPTLGEDNRKEVDRTSAENIIGTARASGSTLLDEFQSKKLLAAYGIPVVETVTVSHRPPRPSKPPTPPDTPSL